MMRVHELVAVKDHMIVIKIQDALPLKAPHRKTFAVFMMQITSFRISHSQRIHRCKGRQRGLV